MAYWLMYISAVLICIIVVLSSVPNAWADKFLAKFKTHPAIGPDSTVTVNGSPLADEDKQQFIADFNNAAFRYAYTLARPMPSYEDGVDVRVTAKLGRKVVNFTLYPYEDHIDIVKQAGSNVTPYRIEADSLQQRVLSRRTDAGKS